MQSLIDMLNRDALSTGPERDEGQALAEYGMILALVAVVAISTLTFLGLGISGALDDLTAAFG